MSLLSLASYPNSRVKPRAATTEANTLIRVVPAIGTAGGTVLADGGVVTANGNILLLAEDQDRTYIELFNNSNSDICYSYTDDANMEQRTLQDGGMTLPKKASISLESKQTLYAKSKTASSEEVSLDVGRG